MGRRIVVSSNCQTGGLHTALSAMLPDDRVVQYPWLGVETRELLSMIRHADFWLVSMPRQEALEIREHAGSSATVIVVPAVWFGAFHPDQTPLLTPSGRELHGPIGPYHSKIVLWCWAHGFTPGQTIAAFNAEAFTTLGYTQWWAPAVESLRTIFDSSDLTMSDWLLPLQRRGVFMLTNNHPRIDAIIQLARLVARRLGAPAEGLSYPWELVVPDGLLATSFVWPVYPGIAESLDLPGRYIWRLKSGEIIGLEEFVLRSFATYEPLDPSGLDTVHLDLDPRFEDALAANRARAGWRTAH